MAENKSIMPLVDNPIEGWNGARVGYSYGAKAQRRACADSVRQELNVILVSPACELVDRLTEYVNALSAVANGTEGQLSIPGPSQAEEARL